MAEQATAPDDVEEKKSGGMMKTMMMAAGIFIIVLAAQTVAPLISSKLGLAPPVVVQAPEGEAGAGEEGEPAEKPPIYWPLKPAMVVNFAGSGAASFLQIEIEIMARDQATIDQVKEHTPALRNALLLLLASQTDEDIFSTEGKQALRESALGAINEVLTPYIEEDAPVEAVYFTSFVAQ